MEILVNIITIALCAFILVITIVSHVALSKVRSDTMGRKIYRWLLVLFSLCGFWFGFKPATYIFLFAAVITERLIVYKGCRAKKDWLGRWLVKIGW